MPTMTRPTTASLLRKNRRRRSPNWVWTRMPERGGLGLGRRRSPPTPASRVTSPDAGGAGGSGAASVIALLQPDPGVEDGVRQVDQQVDEHEDAARRR